MVGGKGKTKAPKAKSLAAGKKTAGKKGAAAAKPRKRARPASGAEKAAKADRHAFGYQKGRGGLGGSKAKSLERGGRPQDPLSEQWNERYEKMKKDFAQKEKAKEVKKYGHLTPQRAAWAKAKGIGDEHNNKRNARRLKHANVEKLADIKKEIGGVNKNMSYRPWERRNSYAGSCKNNSLQDATL